MNGLYKIKRTLERRNHTTKMKVDARDYHTRLLRMLLLRYYYCYARNNSGTCCTVSFARALGRGGLVRGALPKLQTPDLTTEDRPL